MTTKYPSYLQIFRKRSGLTQWEVGQRLGLSHQVIHEWEIGRRKVPEQYRKKLCELLDCGGKESVIFCYY